MRILEDQILVWRCKRGDKTAMCRVYEKYQEDLLTIAAHLLGDRTSAEDVLQDVLLRFVESLDTFHLTGSLKAYLSTCVVNRCRDHFRRIGRDKLVPIDSVMEAVSADKNPLQTAIHTEQVQRLSNALAEIPYPQREAVVMHLTGGMTFRAIAILQEVSTKTVLSRYRYGLDKLRSLLNGEVNK